jgi:hypothetical protein
VISTSNAIYTQILEPSQCAASIVAAYPIVPTLLTLRDTLQSWEAPSTDGTGTGTGGAAGAGAGALAAARPRGARGGEGSPDAEGEEGGGAGGTEEGGGSKEASPEDDGEEELRQQPNWD